VTKKQKKKPGTLPTLPSINQRSHATSNISEGGSRSEAFDPPPFMPQDQPFAMGSQYPPPIPSNSPPAPILQHNSPQYQVMQPAPQHRKLQTATANKQDNPIGGERGCKPPLPSPTNRTSQQSNQAESRMLLWRQILGHSSMDHHLVGNIFGHKTLWLHKTRFRERHGRKYEGSLCKVIRTFDQG
jgi:hypothetical protein